MNWQYLPRILSVDALYTAFERICEAGFYFDGEMHDFWEMVYLAEGQAGAAADDAIYHLHQGQLLFHKPLEFHRLWAEGGSCPRFLILSFQLSGAGAKQLENRLFALNYAHQVQLESLFSQIKATHMGLSDTQLIQNPQANPLDLQRISNTMEQLLLSLLKEPALTGSRNHTQSAQNYSLLVHTIETHLTEPLSLERLAVFCNMSTSNIKKTFAKYAGQGVKQYIIRRKISRAAELLSEGYTVTETSDLLSFSSQSYFSTVFRQVTGQIPSAYCQKASRPQAK